MSTEPDYRAQSKTDNRYCAEFYIPHSLCYLVGHFPGAPLVPAFVQLQWIIGALKSTFDEPCGSWSIERVKFVAPLIPSRTYRMEITRDSVMERFQFHISDVTNVCTTGSLRISRRD